MTAHYRRDAKTNELVAPTLRERVEGRPEMSPGTRSTPRRSPLNVVVEGEDLVLVPEE
jgi:hypothetical protein